MKSYEFLRGRSTYDIHPWTSQIRTEAYVMQKDEFFATETPREAILAMVHGIGLSGDGKIHYFIAG